MRKGYIINKKEIASEFGVNVRTIQRDFDDIRNYLADKFQGQEIIYDYQAKGYIIDNQENKVVSAVEIFTFIKILIESRAFCDAEMNGLINSIFSVISKSEQNVIKSLVSNEVFHFKPLTHNKPILKNIWDIAQCILRKEVIEIQFKKVNGEEGRRVIYPLSIVFSEFYFYLVAQIEEFENKEPAFFRVDRILKFKLLGRKFKAKRFEEGELKKRILFMYGGELLHLKFIYKGQAVEAILDRFPTAKILNQSQNEYLIEAEVYGKGCLMWLLSQGENIELISPIFLREEIKNKIAKMNERYSMERLRV
ncbi:helix-turn-helix transcriptional regulator [Clostridium folliculivorans]|uniref:helix-turn-helix transcriptional regulator n=1 Tax=Clostridium folliculivorans TaxID=2886038 RepID=UPI0021C3D204|nr:WYL domain-containing protein [Clostridium folliculivorans]GKU29335.1 WYL domain-containing protein [Clostridium folliculivorans]